MAQEVAHARRDARLGGWPRWRDAVDGWGPRVLWDRRSVLVASAIRSVVAVAAIVCTASLAAAGDPGYATTRLRLRECPRVSPDCAVLTVLDPGTRVEIVERDGDWLRVRTSAGAREGWVAARYIREGEPPEVAASTESGGTVAPPTLLSRLKSIAIGLGLLVVIAVLAGIAFRPFSPPVRIPGPASRSSSGSGWRR